MLDKQGRPLPGAHIAGFFRRICKLLFFGLRPVFVFDGNPPELKLKTLSSRKQRQANNESSLRKTAERLVEAQMRLSLVQSQSNFQFPLVQHKDEYTLPTAPCVDSKYQDPRLASEEELQSFIREHLDDIEIGYSALDTTEFQKLPITVQHDLILNMKLKSRQTSYERLAKMTAMAKDSLDFSQLQIQNLVHRNRMTQKYNEFTEHANLTKNPLAKAYHQKWKKKVQAGRVAGERNKKYVLLKNDDEHGGYSLKLNVENPLKRDFEESHENPLELVNRLLLESKKKISIGKKPRLEANFEQPLEEQTRPEFEEIDQSQIEFINEKELLLNWKSFAPSDLSQFVEKADDEMEKMLQLDLSELELELKKITKRKEKLPEREKDKLRIMDFWSDYLNAVLNWKLQNLVTTSDLGMNEPLFKEIIGQSSNSEPETRNEPTFQSVQAETSIIETTTTELVDDFSLLQAEPSIIELTTTDQGDDFPLLQENVESKSRVAISPSKKVVPNLIFDDSDNSSEEEFFSVPLINQPAIDVSDESGVEHSLIEPFNETNTIPMGDKSNINAHQSINIVQQPIAIELQSNIPAIEEIDQDANSTIIEPAVFNHESQQFISLDKDVIDLISDSEDEESFQKQMEEEVKDFSNLIMEITTNPTQLQSDLQKEIAILQTQKRKNQRDAIIVSDDMISDVQELLRLFGLPFMIARAEAESQCAYLYQERLVHGIITDDSDVFLFGGSKVYRNFFNQKKYVECYEMEQVEKELGIDREKLIYLAFLLGSDYTSGIKGIGLVSAVEIMKKFPDPCSFKLFWEQVQCNADPKTTDPVLKKIRSLCKKIHLPSNFPDDRVEKAYLQPTVDEDRSAFQWGTLDLNGIRDFMERKVGWDQSKVDNVLLPVLKHLQQAQSRQTSLDQFFKIDKSPAKDKLKSNRLKQAIGNWKEPLPNADKPILIQMRKSKRGKRK